ncbi:hypothetical protein [Cryobacterium glaciale]|nr:hypothetical protein [Cryobacterium glaciale]
MPSSTQYATVPCSRFGIQAVCSLSYSGHMPTVIAPNLSILPPDRAQN